ncbi:MAG: (2Fe-2S)-binding protein [Gammaproteobacteria bacterium]|nr:(2Fe-2S)-binding protein [Gammaproteobacteria bacterium]
MYICICKAVTDHDIHAAIDAGATDLPQLQAELGVGTCCGACKDCVCKMLDERAAQPPVKNPNNSTHYPVLHFAVA